MIEWLVANFAYAGVFIVLVISGFGLPIPEDITLLAAGVACRTGSASLHLMIPMTFVAIVGADAMVFGLGRRYGYLVPKLPFFRRLLTKKRLAKASDFLHEHGGKSLFLARFMPGLRTPIYFTAGLLHVSWWKFIVADGIAALISVPAIVLLGYFFADQLDKVKDWLTGTQLALLVPIAVIAYFVWHKWRQKRRDKDNDQDNDLDLPEVDHARPRLTPPSDAPASERVAG